MLLVVCVAACGGGEHADGTDSSSEVTSSVDAVDVDARLFLGYLNGALGDKPKLRHGFGGVELLRGDGHVTAPAKRYAM